MRVQCPVGQLDKYLEVSMPVIMPCAGDVCTHCRVVRAVKQKAKLVLFSFVLKGEWEHLN
jgi:hypothetical protein